MTTTRELLQKARDALMGCDELLQYHLAHEIDAHLSKEEAAHGELQKWISVADWVPTMPPKGKAFVWVYGPNIQGFNNVVLARFTGTKFVSAEDSDTLHPTHWMPLPASPVEAAKGRL